jgi:methyl-accepting chemotaxis protein
MATVDSAIADVGHTINAMANVEVVNEIHESTLAVKSGSADISSGNYSLSSHAEQQAASLEETSAAMGEITTTVQHNAANAIQANTWARGARETAENGGDVVSKAKAAKEIKDLIKDGAKRCAKVPHW